MYDMEFLTRAHEQLEQCVTVADLKRLDGNIMLSSVYQGLSSECRSDYGHMMIGYYSRLKEQEEGVRK